MKASEFLLGPAKDAMPLAIQEEVSKPTLALGLPSLAEIDIALLTPEPLSLGLVLLRLARHAETDSSAVHTMLTQSLTKRFVFSNPSSVVQVVDIWMWWLSEWCRKDASEVSTEDSAVSTSPPGLDDIKMVICNFGDPKGQVFALKCLKQHYKMEPLVVSEILTGVIRSDSHRAVREIAYQSLCELAGAPLDKWPVWQWDADEELVVDERWLDNHLFELRGRTS